MGMAGYVVNIGKIARLAVPTQIAEIASALYGTADAGLRGEDGDDDGIMVGGEIDNAHYALAADNTHIAVYAVGRAFVDSDEIVALMHTVVYHLGGGKLVALQHRRSRKGSVERVPFLLGKFLGKYLHLVLEVSIAHGKLLIECCQMEVMLHGRVNFIHLGCHDIGRRYPHSILIVVVSEQQNETRHFEQKEYKPMKVDVYEIEEIAHVLSH